MFEFRNQFLRKATFLAIATPATINQAAGHEAYIEDEAYEDEVLPSLVAPEIIPSAL